jgi:hypothetical protein
MKTDRESGAVQTKLAAPLTGHQRVGQITSEC